MNIAVPVTEVAASFAKSAAKSWAKSFGGSLTGAFATEGARMLIGRSAAATIALVAGHTVGSELANPIVDAALEASTMAAGIALYNMLHSAINMRSLTTAAASLLLACTMTPLANTANPAFSGIVSQQAADVSTAANDFSLRKVRMDYSPKLG